MEKVGQSEDTRGGIVCGTLISDVVYPDVVFAGTLLDLGVVPRVSLPD